MQIHISKDGQSYGPYTPAQISQMLQNGEVSATDSLWVQSTEWEIVSTLPGLFGLRPETPTSVAAPVSRDGGGDRLQKTSSGAGTGGFSSSQTTSHRIRHGMGAEYEGTANLMKDALGL